MPQLDIPGKIRQYIREELDGLYTMSLARVEQMDHGTQRCRCSLAHDSDVELDDVPIAVPFAHGGGGDIHPLSEGDKGLVLFNREPLETMLQHRDHDPEQDDQNQRRHSVQDAVFCPLMPYHDDDDIPDHTPGDRIISHPSGTMVRFGTDGGLHIEHATGVELEFRAGERADTEPEMSEYMDGWAAEEGDDDRYPVDQDLIETADAFPDGIETSGLDELLLDAEQRWPPEDEGFGRFKHDESGVELYITRGGVAVAPGEQDITSAENLAALQERVNAGGLSYGRPTDPMRIELESHRHLIPNDDGSYMLTGPPVPHRELFELYLADIENMQNSDSSHHQRTKEELGNYLAWLEEKTGETLDPSPDRDGIGDIIPPGDEADTSNWPAPEHVPSVAERLGFDPYRERIITDPETVFAHVSALTATIVTSE